jgi:carbonic anhydrase
VRDVEVFLAGFRRFQARFFGGDRELYEELRHGQRPHALVIACCDSRVDPAHLLDARPGDLFVVRNVANLVPPYESDGATHGVSAALEFAVRSLGVAHICVLGHGQCGGVRALLEGAQGEFLPRWVAIAQEARDEVLARLPGKSLEMQARACEQASLLLSLRNLLTFPWVAERVEAGTLALHGWYFDLERGRLLGYDAATGRFIPLA